MDSTLIVGLANSVAIIIGAALTRRQGAGISSDLADNTAKLEDAHAEVADVHAVVAEVRAEVHSINGQTTAQIVEANEGRRIESDIPAAERTPGEQGYVDRLDPPNS